MDEGRSRALDIVEDLDDEQLVVPWLPTINPLLWELCHASFFFEHFFLREGANQPAVLPGSEALFDSMNIGHETRWRLPVPGRSECLDYVNEVRDRVVAVVDEGLDDHLTYLLRYCIYHLGMHNEATTYTRQTLGYSAPTFSLRASSSREPVQGDSDAFGDATIDGGPFVLGAAKDVPFCFDNEKWGHEVDVEPFAIARTAVTEGEYRAFVVDGGYERSEHWGRQGWAWRQAVGAIHPIYWRDAGDGEFERRHFDKWVPLEDTTAVIHVCWYEAVAFCHWAKRRLPTEAEWEMAAAFDPSGGKRVHPWGDAAPSAALCNLEWQAMGPVNVTAHPDGDSAPGCRQLTGNVWEWTNTTFAPYPGFSADMYSDYSQVSFHTRKVLRGGSWATPWCTMRNTWRNFFQPARRDIFGGFRTCRL